jgi:hypothetical protein
MSAEAIAPARPRRLACSISICCWSCQQLLRLDLFKGEKRERLHRAFIGSAVYLGNEIMPDLEGRLPTSRRRTPRWSCTPPRIDLCLRAGLSRRDLTEALQRARRARHVPERRRR